jgi:hypothetical protein
VLCAAGFSCRTAKSLAPSIHGVVCHPLPAAAAVGTCDCQLCQLLQQMSGCPPIHLPASGALWVLICLLHMHGIAVMTGNLAEWTVRLNIHMRERADVRLSKAEWSTTRACCAPGATRHRDCDLQVKPVAIRVCNARFQRRSLYPSVPILTRCPPCATSDTHHTDSPRVTSANNERWATQHDLEAASVHALDRRCDRLQLFPALHLRQTMSC